MGGFTRLIIFVSIIAAQWDPLTSDLLPITKHEPTNQFYTTFNIGSASKSPVNLLFDLGTNLTWLNCRKIKSLSSLRLVTCQSSTCRSISGNSCQGKTCIYRQPNPLGKNPVVTGRVVQDKASIYDTDSLGRFTFSCADEKNLQGLPPPVAGVLGLSPGKSSFWSQVAKIPKFSICLPSSGTGRFYISDGLKISAGFFTPMKGTNSGDYQILVQSIYVDGTPLSLNPNLLNGGAKISTVVPYSVLQTDIYNTLAHSFTRKAKAIGISKVSPVAPFKNCFDARAAEMNMTGPNVPVIEIGLPGKIREEKWRFYGANTVVNVKEGVMCLAFLDGGKKPKELMVVGTYQLQDYLLEMDFTTTFIWISESLLLHLTSCSS